MGRAAEWIEHGGKGKAESSIEGRLFDRQRLPRERNWTFILRLCGDCSFAMSVHTAAVPCNIEYFLGHTLAMAVFI